MLKTGEVIEDLQYKGLRIIQQESAFHFGTDAVLLANFAKARKGERVVDLGTGTGIIAILMSGKTNAKEIVGVEIQEKSADMAQRSVELNGIENIRIIHGDFRQPILEKNSFHVAVSNPPYRKIGSGDINLSDEHVIARHEVHCNLAELAETAKNLLVNQGRFYMVHQAERLADIFCALRDNNLEPKTVRLIHPKPEKAPNLVLIEAIKGAKSHIKWLPPLYVMNENNEYTTEMKRIYSLEVETNE